MKDTLLQLLEGLEAIGNSNEEIYDSEIRHRLSAAVLDGFIRQTANFTLPASFGMRDKSDDKNVREVLRKFIQNAIAKAKENQLDTFHKRLAVFQDEEASTSTGENGYDDFFGWWNPKDFDAAGNATK